MGNDSFGILGMESIGNDPVYDALFGKSSGSYEAYAGIIRNKVGLGAGYKQNRWRFSADLYDPNDLTMRIRGTYGLNDNFYIIGQSILPHSNRGGGEYIGVGYNY